MRIITISREFGSGGRELGKRLADSLGCKYYDKDIITEIAKRAELDENYVESKLEKGFDTASCQITFAHSFMMSYANIDRDVKILNLERCIINEIAAKGEDFVIVGRNADILLSKYSPLNIFVYADIESRVARCIAHVKENEGNITAKELKKKIKQIDSNRAKYRELLTSCKWGQKESFDLCINTSNIVIKSIIPSLTAYVDSFFSNRKA